MQLKLVKIDQISLKEMLLKVKVKKGCWEWQGKFTLAGYPVQQIERERAGESKSDVGYVSASRIIYQFFEGLIPREKNLRAICSNRSCVDPRHRALARSGVLACDTAAKSVQGSSNPNAKLNSEQVVEMRRRAFEGETQVCLADYFKVSRMTVSKIVHRQLWSHIE